MERVDELLSITGWQSEPQEIDWNEVERKFGTSLPVDFKEISELFGHGAFSGYLKVLPVNGAETEGILGRWDSMREYADKTPLSGLFDPYEVFHGETGLILWGNSMTEAQYFWLANASSSPEKWPIVARTSPLDDWHQFDEISTSEFICRILKDPEFRPFSISRKVGRPFFEAYR
ncbi:hypothetical protein OG696_06795 [Streptomyces sp. NBC_00656]|uniref:hypothetical protein n=1 Tax=Streptomyces sp. NBC_00656 TaxID=2903668 RepID=UPI0032471A06